MNGYDFASRLKQALDEDTSKNLSEIMGAPRQLVTLPGTVGGAFLMPDPQPSGTLTRRLFLVTVVQVDQ